MAEARSDPAAGTKPRRGRPPSVGLAERRRAELTEAAFAVFADEGYEQASVADIAKRAGMGQGTLYRYVDGKRELLDLVFDRCVEELMGAISPDEVIATAAGSDLQTAEQLVETLGARLFHLIDTRPEILKVIVVQSGTVDEELRYRIQGLYQTFDTMMGRTLAHARERGWIVTRSEDAEAETVQLGRLLPALGVPGLVMALNGVQDPELRTAYVRTASRLSAGGILVDGARAAAEADEGQALDLSAESEPRPVGRAAELLEAAIAEFVENGYAAVGVREITERAGVSHGTFYNYFDSKRHMLSVLVERNRELLLGRLDRVVEQLPTPLTAAHLRAAVHEATRATLRDIDDRLDEFRFLTLEVPGVDTEAFETYVRMYSEAAGRLAAVLVPAQEAGLVITDVDAGMIAEFWLGYLLGVVAAMVNDIEVSDTADSTTVVTDLLLFGARPL